MRILEEFHNGSISSMDAQLRMERPAYSQDDFNDISEYVRPQINKLKHFCHEQAASCRPMKILRGIFPVFEWIPQYNWKVDLPCDVIAGVTVAIMHIPQGLAYALLANVPAVVGIYMAFFPQIPYFLFSTSRHNSMGTFAVIQLMVGRSVVLYGNNTEFTHPVYQTVNGTTNLTEVPYTMIEVGTALTLLVSFWQFLFYICRMGIICTLLSDALVNSFVCAAGIHIFTSQIKEVLGIKPKRFTGPLQLLYTYQNMWDILMAATPKSIRTTYACLAISAVCITLLLINVYLIKPFLAKYTKIPFPCELVLVIAGVFVAQALSFDTSYGVPAIGVVEKGIPAPVVPYLNLAKELLVNSFVTAVVAYAISMSMAFILADGENYEVDANQEILAHGMSNFVGSMFSCVAIGASLSRSMVLRGVGGKTQFTGLIAAGIIVIVLLWIADFFQPLPKALLASIIIVALQKILLQVTDMPKFWKKSKMDGIVWIIVFLSVIVIDIDYGLGIGFLLSAGMIFIYGLKAYTCLLGNIPQTDLYLDVNRYKAAVQIDGVKIVHYRGALYFATRQHLKLEIMRLTGIDPQKEKRRRKRLEKKLLRQNAAIITENGENNLSVDVDCEGVINVAFIGEQTNYIDPQPVRNIILDFSALSSIDPAGAAQVKKIAVEYADVDITVMIAGCSGPVYEKIKKCGYLEGAQALRLFPTIHDAVHYTQNTNRTVVSNLHPSQLAAAAL